MRRAAVVILALLAVAPPPLGHAQQSTSVGNPQGKPSDLDTFMEQVLARRDDNWKKLQQYVLDEKERVELRGPSEALVWGQQREYTWYVREGYFVRSPVRFNGVAISESERQKYEDDFLKRARQREKDRQKPSEPAAVAPASAPPPTTVQGFITQTREPQFISSAYFLQFKFEPGRYALVGREKVDDRDVLKIEYYPERMFSDAPKTRTEARVRSAAQGPRHAPGTPSSDEAFDDQMQRLMNKTSLVTLWVEASQHQIVKFTFDNAGLDFLPAAWLARIADLRASMLMSEAFPGVWLPKRVDTTGSIVLAVGRSAIRYSLDYHNYREATVTTTIHGAAR